VHIADTTADAIAAAGLHTVGLLGTAFTMEQPFYRDRLASRGIRALVPNEADRRTVHEIIYGELVHGVVTDDARERYRDVMARLHDAGAGAGAEGIILGCTEIELLVTRADSPVPVFPTTALHVDAAVAFALGADGS